MRNRCSNCRWWNVMHPGLRFGECRLDAPIRNMAKDTSEWPTTNHDDWCGQWKPALVPEEQKPPYGTDET